MYSLLLLDSVLRSRSGSLSHFGFGFSVRIWFSFQICGLVSDLGSRFGFEVSIRVCGHFFGFGPLGASEDDFYGISISAWGCAALVRGPRRIMFCGPLFVLKPLKVIRFAVFVTISRLRRDPPRVGETPGFGPLGASEGDFYEISLLPGAAPQRPGDRAALCFEPLWTQFGH